PQYGQLDGVLIRSFVIQGNGDLGTIEVAAAPFPFDVLRVVLGKFVVNTGRSIGSGRVLRRRLVRRTLGQSGIIRARSENHQHRCENDSTGGARHGHSWSPSSNWFSAADRSASSDSVRVRTSVSVSG